MLRIEWVFFDVGNVIFSDDKPVAFYWWKLAQRVAKDKDATTALARLLRGREELIRNGITDYPSRHLALEYLGKEGHAALEEEFRAELSSRYDELVPVLPGVTQVLETTHRLIPMGLLANQPAECAQSLKRRGLWSFFKVHGISDIVGMSKPDVAFFRWALEQAGVRAEQCVMVGDRMDNDVTPAKALGMKTVLLYWRDVYDKGVTCTTDYERMYLDSVNRASVQSQGLQQFGPGHADYIVHSTNGLGTLLQSLLSKDTR